MYVFLRVVFSGGNWNLQLESPPLYFKNNLSDVNTTLYNWYAIYLNYVESKKVLTSTVISDVLSFFITKKYQKIQKIDENR